MEGDALNNVAPEVSAQGAILSQKLEDVLLVGSRFFQDTKAQGIEFKKMYFLGPKGNRADEVAEALLDSLAYIPAPDGTLMLQRKQHGEYPPIEYFYWDTDDEVNKRCKEQGIDPVTLYQENEDKYRKMETDVLKEFAVAENPKGLACGCVVGESALQRPENIEIIKQGLVFYLQCDKEASWKATQSRVSNLMGVGGGGYVAKPPIWALAQDMVGDVDNTEFKEEYVRILGELEEDYKAVSDLELYTDTRGIAENSYWAVPRLVALMSEKLGVKAAVDNVDSDVALEKAVTDFLEGARLSKYLDTALKWCDEQGAASIEDIVENPEEFVEALGLKPLEKKRFTKACEGALI